MSDLHYLFSLLENFRQQNNVYRLQLLDNGPSVEYFFGFSLGEYNLKNQNIISIIELIKTNHSQEFLKYCSMALSYHFQKLIIQNQKKMESHQNEYNYHKQLPDWDPKYEVCYESLISTASKIIHESHILLTKNKIQDFYDYFIIEGKDLHVFDNLKACINDTEYFKSNYGYFKIFECIYEFYCFEYNSFLDFNQKENSLYEYLSQTSNSILEDRNYKKYGLITFSKEYEPICTKYLACRLYHKQLDFTIPLSSRMDNSLFQDFINLVNQGTIVEVSFRPQFITPLKGRYAVDMALEALEFGKIFDSNFKNLVPTKLYEDSKDTLWIRPEQENNSITFEEILYDFNTFEEYIMTQVIHLLYYEENNSYFIEHLDHEIIFYSFQEYDKRLKDISQKGEIKERQKTFKISKSKIPFFTNGRPEFLIKVLYTYFNNKELLNEYFSKFR